VFFLEGGAVLATILVVVVVVVLVVAEEEEEPLPSVAVVLCAETAVFRVVWALMLVTEGLLMLVVVAMAKLLFALTGMPLSQRQQRGRSEG
jgi:hypothetical protein